MTVSDMVDELVAEHADADDDRRGEIEMRLVALEEAGVAGAVDAVNKVYGLAEWAA